MILNKSGTNIYENASDIKLTNYWFDDWNWTKLSVDTNGFNLFQKIIAKVGFSEFDNQNEINNVAALLTSVFCENNNPVKANEIIDVQPTINYDDFIADHFHFDDESAKEKIRNCNGTEEHPYVIPTEMFWKLNETEIVENYDYLKSDNTFGLIWSTYLVTNPEFINDVIDVKIQPLNTDNKFVQVNINDQELIDTAYFTWSSNNPTIEDFEEVRENPINFQLKFTCNDKEFIKYFRIMSLTNFASN